MAEITVRTATPNDIATIQQVAYLTWEDTYASFVDVAARETVLKTSYSYEALRKVITAATPDMWFWVAEATEPEASTMVGYADVWLRGKVGTDAEITRIYVLPTYQHTGVGSALMQVIFKHIQSLPTATRPERLWVAVAEENQGAIKFYEKWNFQLYQKYQASLAGQEINMREYVLTFTASDNL